MQIQPILTSIPFWPIYYHCVHIYTLCAVHSTKYEWNLLVRMWRHIIQMLHIHVTVSFFLSALVPMPFIRFLYHIQKICIVDIYYKYFLVSHPFPVAYLPFLCFSISIYAQCFYTIAITIIWECCKECPEKMSIKISDINDDTNIVISYTYI